jgi:hypothetical protein
MAVLEDTTDAAGKTIDVVPCTTLYVKVKETSTNGALVTVPGLHGSDQYPMDVGEEKYFRVLNQALKSFRIAGNGGAVAFKWSAVALTYGPT